jgi:hypothetical protein
MGFDFRTVLLGFAILYSVVWVMVGLKTGAMPSARGKHYRATNPKAFWLQMTLRGAIGVFAAYILISGR